MTKFDLSNYETKGRTAWYTLPIESEPKLKLLHAGRSNRAYTTAVAKHVMKSSRGNQSARGRVNIDMIEANLQTDRELFSLHVVMDWDGVRDTDGKIVPFSRENCLDFLNALPDWMMQDVSLFAGVAQNFLPDDMPTEDEVDEHAGK